MLKRYEDSQQYLTENAHLACEETANYLVLWCVNLEVEEVPILFQAHLYQLSFCKFCKFQHEIHGLLREFEWAFIVTRADLIANMITHT